MANDDIKRSVTRRQTLTAFAAAGATTLPFGAQAQPTATSRLLPGANVCILTPQTVEGPFYFDPKLERVDITEGKMGVPLGLQLQVVEARDCAPVKGARVDVWHADALGYYSGYDGQSDGRTISTKGQHFLRGSQFSDDAGLVRFTTIYPGWYQGRTTHIHCKIFLDDRTMLTAQLYFPDALSEYIYKNVRPYNARVRDRDTINTTDMLVRADDASRASFCSIKEEADRYLASLLIGIGRDAIPAADRGPPSGPPPGGGGPRRALPRGSLVPGIVTST